MATPRAAVSLLSVLLLLIWCRFAIAQTSAPERSKSEIQFSPQAAYDQAIRPFEMIRSSPQNWSEVELSALKVARDRAGAACDARNPDSLTGEDLLALARLCAFAQRWQPVDQAASNYLAPLQSVGPAEKLGGPGNLSIAYDYKVQASLNLDNAGKALVTAQKMLQAVPYDLFTSEAVNSVVRYLQFVQTDEVLALLAQRQPALLFLIESRGSINLGATVPAEASVAAPGKAPSPLSLHALYADAIALPAMQQFAGRPEAAASSYSELAKALPISLPSEDAMLISESRRQYLLLGSHLPALNAMGSLFPDATVPGNLNTWFGSVSIFLLFPDWCNQCVAMAFSSTTKSRELIADYHIRFFSLLAQENPPEKRVQSPIKSVPSPTSRLGKAAGESGPLHVNQRLAMNPTPDALLEGTPTIVVSNEILDKFATADYPLIVATDYSGIVRFIQRASENAFVQGGQIDQIVQHILITWPPA